MVLIFFGYICGIGWYDFSHDKAKAVMMSDLENYVRDDVTNKLADALYWLPESLQYLEADEFFCEIDINGVEAVVESYLSDLGDDDSFDENDEDPCEMDPIDAIFQR